MAIPSTLDPRFALDAEGMKIGGLLFQSLIKIGPDMNVVGDAAQSWQLQKKNLEYHLKFSLKPNLTFSDGSKVTCEDLRFSVAQYKADTSPFKSAFANILDSNCDENSFTLTFDSYSEKVLNSDLPVLKILPKKVVETQKENFKSNLVGSGPFKLKALGETVVVLEPNSFYKPKVKLKAIEFKVIKDDFTRFLKMYRGDLDLAISALPKNKIASLKKLDFLEVIRRPGLKMAYILVNFKNPLLKGFKYRRLLYQSLNIDEVIKYKLEGLAERATSILTPINPYYNKQLISYLPQTNQNVRQDVLGSKALEQVLVLKTSNTREVVENAKLIVNQLRKQGFRIRHESYEWGTFYKDTQEGNFDLATMTWVGAYDPDIYRIAFDSRELPPDGRNRGYYENAQIDKLVRAGAEELDSKKRKELYLKVQEIVVKDLAILPLWYEDTITVIHKRVKNYTPSLNGDYSGLIQAEIVK